MAIAIINNVPASAHARRVTLNLLRHSVTTPSIINSALDRIHDCGYDMTAVAREDLELVYATVDAELCAQVLSEFEVDTSTMRDYGFPFWRVLRSGRTISKATTPNWFHGVHEVDCRLCGHKHNRYEFLARNTAGGEDIWMGSTCIGKYGLVVDGEATAEAALKALNKAKSVSKQAQTKAAWQADNPGYEATIEALSGALSSCVSYVGYSQFALLPMYRGEFQNRRHNLAKSLRGALTYYRKHGYLTPKRTTDVLTNRAVLREARLITTLYRSIVAGKDVSKCLVNADGSIEADPEIEARVAHWQKFIDDNKMNDYQLRAVTKLRGMAADHTDLENALTPRQYSWLNGVVEEVKTQNSTEPEPEQTTLPF
jgi:hypothetical protein